MGGKSKNGLKGEVIYFHPQNNWQDSLGSVSASISVDYVFNGNLYVMGGLFFNSLGADITLNIAKLAN